MGLPVLCQSPFFCHQEWRSYIYPDFSPRDVIPKVYMKVARRWILPRFSKYAAARNDTYWAFSFSPDLKYSQQDPR